MQLNINTDSVVKFTNALEKMHKSALPSAVRGALNNAAFDVKKNTMPARAAAEFENRQANFFKANSKFENAKGFNINTMKSTIGFVEGSLKGGNNYAVKDLEQQEEGGRIGGKSFIPTIFARKGGVSTGAVRANARLSSIKNIIDAKRSHGVTKKQNFLIAAKLAGKGGHVLSEGVLWRIDSDPKILDKNKTAFTYKGKGTTYYHFKGQLKRTPLYGYRKSRTVQVHKTGFMKASSLESAAKIEQHFIKEAKRQIEKFK